MSKSQAYTAQDYELPEIQTLHPQLNAQHHQGKVSRKKISIITLVISKISANKHNLKMTSTYPTEWGILLPTSFHKTCEEEMLKQKLFEDATEIALAQRK